MASTTMIHLKTLQKFRSLLHTPLRHGHRHMSSNVRVRFAPSPTGEMHLGGLRTALYNYLYARSHKGKFILRVEDTDQSRVVPGAMDKLEGVLNWAGIEIDEGPNQGGDYGPYIQSERRWIYQEMIQELVQNGSAYHCFCSQKRLGLLRKEAIKRGEIPKYDNRCRDLKTKEVDDELRNGTPFTIRLRLEPNTDPWQDMVYGPIICDLASVEGDPILMKSDRYPTYHFANVVDDHLMEVSHVLRGVEWQVSTAKHLLMYNSFGWEFPHYGHLPLLMNSNGKKLSKRQNDAVVEFYKVQGYLPEALISMLTSMGGAFKTREHSHMTLNELVEQFDLTMMLTNSTMIDVDKAKMYNKEHLKRYLASPLKEDVINNVRDMVIERFYASSTFPEDVITEYYMNRVMDWAIERINLLPELLEANFQFLWRLPDPAMIDKLYESHEHLFTNLQATYQSIQEYPDENMSHEELVTHLKILAERSQTKYGPFMKQLRLVFSGLTEGPSVAEIIHVFGKEQTLMRLKHAIDRYGNS